jgi:hypothetical protein
LRALISCFSLRANRADRDDERHGPRSTRQVQQVRSGGEQRKLRRELDPDGVDRHAGKRHATERHDRVRAEIVALQKQHGLIGRHRCGGDERLAVAVPIAVVLRSRRRRRRGQQ